MTVVVLGIMGLTVRLYTSVFFLLLTQRQFLDAIMYLQDSPSILAV